MRFAVVVGKQSGVTRFHGEKKFVLAARRGCLPTTAN
jgi:hypothetical protein